MSSPLDALKHSTVKINEHDAYVYVLDTGAVIDAEATAMLQALHSRSTGGMQHHLDILKKRGPDKFMANFYVGYGHKSIGDCGTATIFIEGVSMLAAKAIQDWPLYSGQEASTRYIDFQKQRFHNPTGTRKGEEILEAWRHFYSSSLSPVVEALKERFPRQEDENEKTYDKAINARAFDILRGVLPAGATTNLAWHTNLRQAADKLMTLRHHPLAEVRQIADAIEEALKHAYPNSFHHKRYEKTEKYNKQVMANGYYFHDPAHPDFAIESNRINTALLPYDVLATRPAKTELPKFIGEAGTITFNFQLDFGSYRDLQRHRALIQRMPLLTAELGFADWYLSELPTQVREQLETLLDMQKERIANLDLSHEEKQYYIAMGYNTANRITGDLPSLVYMTELRATRFVHPTLRYRAIQIAKYLEETYGDVGLSLHLDQEADRFDVKRGEHDIELKTSDV